MATLQWVQVYIFWSTCAYSSLLPVFAQKQFSFSRFKGVVPLFVAAIYLVSEAIVHAGPLGTDALNSAQDKVRNRMSHALDRLDNALGPQRKFSKTTVREKWALFVGVNHFQDKSIEPL